MGVTIDSIQIEIESSSTNAAKGIDALAKSLEGLKKNGSFKTVSTNLNNLSTALKNLPNVHQASNSLRTLANSIEKLKGVGSVSSLANSLKKLPEALKSVSNINLDKVAPQLERVAEVVAPLSAIKAGGLSSMVNSLKNLDKVTKSLDDETIGRFAEKIEKLNEALGPLSAKMSTIKSAFGSINSKARSATSGVKEFGEGVDTSTLNMSSFIEVARTAIDALQGLIQKFTEFMAEAIEWDGIMARFGRGFGDSASETYAWIQRLNEEMGINIQEFMKYSSVYSTMLTGFGVGVEDAGKMALGYMELTYDIYAGYNDIYNSLEEAAEAVKSAIAGEVEPIRRAGFTIVESTLEQTAANHGLEVSLYNATEAQKSYLRYLTLVDQAYSQNLVGTYAKELNTAEGLMRTFAQQLKSLSQAFGSLFLPILVKVMPWLQAFVELLTEAIYKVAAFFGIEIQKVDFSGYEAGTGAIDKVANSAGTASDALNSATEAAKELKNATLGIDELNVISPSSSTSGNSGGGSGGSGGGSGNGGFSDLDIDSLWNESIFDTIQSNVDEIKTKLSGMFDDWLPTIKIIGAALGGWTIAHLLGQLGNALQLGDDFETKVLNIKKLASSAIIIAIQFKLMKDAFGDFMGEDGTILDYLEGVLIGAAGTYLLYKQWGPMGLAIGLGVTAIVSLKTVIEEGGVTDVESATVAITGLAAGIGALAVSYKSLAKAWEAVKASSFVTGMIEFFTAAKQMAPDVGWLAALFPKLSSALSGLGTAISALSAATLATIAAAVAVIASYIYFIVKNWDELVQGVKDFFGENIAPKLEEIGKHFEKIAEALGPLWDKILKPMFDGVKEFFSNVDLNAILKGLGTVIEWLGALVANFIGNGIFGLINAFASLVEGVIQVASGIIQVVSGLFEILIGIFTLDGEKISNGAKKIGSGIVDVFKGMYDSTIGVVVSFFEGVVHWFTMLWDVLVGHSIVPDTINAIVKWFTSLPSKIFDSVSNFVKGIIDKFKNLGSGLTEKFGSAWNAVKSWWSKKPSLSSYTPNIGSIYDKLKERWDNARTWWNEKKTKLKEYTPSIGSIYEKLYERWKNAREWWNEKKGSFKSYTPSIGSIVDKVKSAWNSAKSWWSKNVSGLSTKLSIKVPTIEVKWKTAEAFGKSFKYPTGFSLKFAANGGIFDQGSLIWAGERGPEVMATAAGGKTGVMNVQQMQDAVYEGVYAAVSAAMRGMSGGGTQAVNVYLDGKQITAAVEQRQHERGASIMGNEVYAY